ncbi:MAG TPA: hypothetical protein VNI78_08715 [Vicinamibacterales bacterium]|nr:hypothetical protein [Vicinamibacterales bacterium]
MRTDHQTQSPPAPPAPSGRALAKATAAALLVAALVLVTAVLPAEYGIDPLGTGRMLGLTDLFAAGAEVDPATPATITPLEGGPVFPQFNEYRVDTREFTIPPNTGIEFKYELDKGATLIYSWKASAFVDFDFHTEPEGKPREASDSFEKGTAAQKRGAYTAPYDGIHGWWWENKTTEPVTLKLTTAGFYDEAMLFLPKQPPRAIEIPERSDAP